MLLYIGGREEACWRVFSVFYLLEKELSPVELDVM